MTITMPARKNAKKKEHYVDNKQFLHELIIYRNKCAQAAEKGEPKPRVSNYIGECFLKIATHLSYRPNFINYMYREDMIGDGIENCIQYIHNFDPEKSSNPFAYFTQIVYYAYLRRIAKEKRQQSIREKILERKGWEEVMHSDDLDNTADMNYIKARVESNTRYWWHTCQTTTWRTTGAVALPKNAPEHWLQNWPVSWVV